MTASSTALGPSWSRNHRVIFQSVACLYIACQFLYNLSFHTFCYDSLCVLRDYYVWWMPRLSGEDLESQIYGWVMLLNLLCALYTVLVVDSLNRAGVVVGLAGAIVMLWPAGHLGAELNMLLAVVLLFSLYYQNFGIVRGAHGTVYFTEAYKQRREQVRMWLWCFLSLWYLTSLLVDSYDLMHRIIAVEATGSTPSIVTYAMQVLGIVVRTIFVLSLWGGVTRKLGWLLVAVLYLPFALWSAQVAYLPMLALIHLLAVNPFWIPPLRAGRSELIFYDGKCGVCHGLVQFVLAEDSRAIFRFAPLGGESFERAFDEDAKAKLPDSILVYSEDGITHARSGALRHIGMRLGGVWRVFAWVSRIVPRVFLDACYDLFARYRKRLASIPKDECPIVPKEIGTRFRA